MSTPATHRIYSDRRWLIVRLACLVRDGWLCRLRYPGCTRTATQADHILELGLGGPAYDLANLQASCKHCNVVKENMRRNGTTPPVSPPSRDW